MLHKNLITSCSFLICLISYSLSVSAQTNNKVVVIPMGSENVIQTYTGEPPIVVDNTNRVISYVPATPIIFKVRGNGFAVKDTDVGTTIETDIWGVEVYDTSNSFSNHRFTVPETGYYYLHANVDQSNFQTESFFRLSFNVDRNSLFSTTVDGDDVDTNVSGVYRLTAGEQVYLNLRNVGPTDQRIDGFGSWFEGYKIN